MRQPHKAPTDGGTPQLPAPCLLLLPRACPPPTPTAQPAHHPRNGAEPPPPPRLSSARLAAPRSPALSPSSSHSCREVRFER
ncbi:hypothetical protein PVAP13_9KG062700 [Panicum virgatum]|uniref:Uncharacterized protein n=1 Tax=Panicum virgatum TaxID=38727 RepID=A0A8T0NIP4_PANVG|nr:hypothetical protein PVAP13_9KG062700 [Panicum virgatum]